MNSNGTKKATALNSGGELTGDGFFASKINFTTQRVNGQARPMAVILSPMICVAAKLGLAGLAWSLFDLGVCND